MEGSYFPDDKDLAHKIMMELINTDLVKICATNKRMYDVCNNYPSFWRNKFVKDYGEHAAQQKPEKRSWKNHYMTVFIDLQRYKKNPINFLNNIAWKDNVDNSYFIDYKNRELIPLKEAPEWVMNNLYLLNLNLKVNNIGGTTTEYENVKPIQFLQEGPVNESYSIGLLNSWNDSFIRKYNDLDTFYKWLLGSERRILLKYF